MSSIFHGGNTYIFYNTDANNNIPTSVTYKNIDELGAFPQVKIKSSTTSLETYNDEWVQVLQNNMSIDSVSIVVHYVADNESHMYLDSAFSTQTNFQIKVALYESQNSLEQHYVILNGYISAYNDSADQNEVFNRTYTFTAEDVVSRGTATDPAQLRVGDYGVGADGETTPQYESATPSGNSFIKVPALRDDNPTGIDMGGFAYVDNGGDQTAQLIMPETGNPGVYIKNTDHDWLKVPLKADNDAIYVPLSRTVNGKALSSNITLSASDVSALPLTGGTLTGILNGTNSNFSSLTLANALPVTSGGTGSKLADGSGAYNISALPIRGQVPSTGIDVNTMGPTADYVGIWSFVSTNQINGSSNIPDATNATLEVFNSGAFGGMQRWTTRYGNVYTRSPTATWTAASPNNWGPWIPASNSVNSTFYTGDLNLLIVPGDYAVTASAINGPWADTTGVAGRVRVETRTPTVTSIFGDVTQTFTIFTTSNQNKNRMWKRTYQSSASTWGGWSEYAQSGDSVGDNYIRNPGFLSGGFLQTISNATTASLEYVNSTDSRVPAGSAGARVAIITKSATGSLNQLNFGSSNDQNTNYVSVAPGQLINYSVQLAATGLTLTTQLRVCLMTYNGTTLVANNRVASYDGATGGWQNLKGQFTIPSTGVNQIILGIWVETTAPANAVVFVTEPSLTKQDPNLISAYSGTMSGTLTAREMNTTYRITQSRSDANPPYITWNRADQKVGTLPTAATQVGFLQTMLTSADGTDPYARSLGQMSMWYNTTGGGIVYLGARNAAGSTTSQLKLDGDLNLATINGALTTTGTITTPGITGLSGTLTLGADAVTAYDAVTLRQLQAATGTGTATINGVMNNFLGAVEWFNGTRAAMPGGHLAADGQLLSRAAYPDLWAAISSGVFSSVTETAWQSTYANRGRYSTGDGSTTFRMPDLNGTQSGSIASPFLRGNAGTTSAIAMHGDTGNIAGGGLPNITGSFASDMNGRAWFPFPATSAGGAFQATTTRPNTFRPANVQINGTAYSTFDTIEGLSTIAFNAANSSSLYGASPSEVRPNFAVGIWLIRVNGLFSAANTNFNVINSDTALPAAGTIVYGGDVRSAYRVAGADNTVARLRSKLIVGSAQYVSLMVDGGTGEMTVHSNGTVNSTAYRALGGTNGVQNASGTGVFDFKVSTDTAAGNLQLARSGTGSFDIGGMPIVNGGQIAFSSTTNARQTMINMGVGGNVNYIRIPINTTQAYQVLCVTAVQTQNSSGDSTVTFPVAFTSINSVICSNGDGAVGNLTMNIINSMRAGGFDVRVYNNGSPQVGAVRINYIATGIVNI